MSDPHPQPSAEQVWEQLHAIIDPELGIDFVDLGLIYDVQIEPGDEGARVHIVFTLTSAGCGIGPSVAQQMEEVVEAMEGVDSVFPRMVFSPQWTPDRMSEETKFALGY